VGRDKVTSPVMYIFDDDLNVTDKDYPLAWSDITNYVEVVATAREVGGTEEIFSSDSVITLAAYEIYKYTCIFNNVPCLNPQSPVITNTGNIAITAYNTFAWGAEITFTNSDAVSNTINTISIQGNPLKSKSSVTLISKDDNLIRDTGEVKVSVEHEFIQDLNYAKTLADTLLDKYKDSAQDATLETRGNIALLLGDKVVIKEDNKEYMVQRQHLLWDGSLEATVDAKKL
jgi:hypothetical protein